MDIYAVSVTLFFLILPPCVGNPLKQGWSVGVTTVCRSHPYNNKVLMWVHIKHLMTDAQREIARMACQVVVVIAEVVPIVMIAIIGDIISG